LAGKAAHKIHHPLLTGDFPMLKKIIFTAALLFALAAATAGVAPVQKQPAVAKEPKEPCIVGLSCPSVESLPPVW